MHINNDVMMRRRIVLISVAGVVVAIVLVAALSALTPSLNLGVRLPPLVPLWPTKADLKDCDTCYASSRKLYCQCKAFAEDELNKCFKDDPDPFYGRCPDQYTMRLEACGQHHRDRLETCKRWVTNVNHVAREAGMEEALNECVYLRGDYDPHCG